MYLLVIPEMIESVQDQLNISEGENEMIDITLSDKVNDMYGFVFALS